MKSNTSKNAKTAAIASYFTLIGVIIAFFINLEEKHEFANFHMRQSLGLQTLFYATGALLGMSQSIWAVYGFYLGFFILWTYALVTCIQNKKEPIPLLGNVFQKVFGFLK